MPFLLLLLFALVCLQGQTGQPAPAPAGTPQVNPPARVSPWPQRPAWLSAEDCAAVTWGGVVFFWLAAGVIAQAACWRLVRDPWQRGRVLRRAGRWRQAHVVVLLGAYLAALYGLGWGRLAHDLWQRDLGLPGVEVVQLAPFLAGLFLTWERFYRLERTAYEQVHYPDRFIGKAAFLSLQARHNFLVVLPPMCLWVLHQAIERNLPESDATQQVLPFLGVGLLVLALIAIPYLLRLFLGLRPLPPGALRDRLEATGKRLGFRYSDVMVWDTRMTVANAMVTGFVPWARYVVLTDRLIDELTPEEVEAVFGHEVGHVKYQHMGMYILFCLTSLVLLGFVGTHARGWALPFLQGLEDLVQYGKGWGLLVETVLNVGAVLGLAVYFFFVFGFLSRRCERQADLFGSRTVSSVAFISALEKVALINGIPRDRAGNWFVAWQHPTIADRVEFLLRASADPHLEPRYHRSVGLLKWSMAAALVLLIWALGPANVWNMMRWL